jgi:ribose transport system permease protein
MMSADTEVETRLDDESSQKTHTKQLSRFKITTELTLLLINIAIFAAMTLLTDTFLSAYNISNLFRQVSIIGIVAISSTLVIISGGIDLSVGSIVGLTAMISAVLMSSDHNNMSMLPALLISLAAGTLVGVYHGLIIYEVRLPPFIATLGSMFVVRGIVKLISGAQTIARLPEAFTDFARLDLLGVPALVVFWLIIAVITTFVLRNTRFGRNIYVIGSSQEVARLSGIRMRLNVYGIYILAAFLCSIAGILLSSRLSSAVPTGGTGYELTAIAAAAIGGASLSGAKGSVLGTVLGTLLMGLITNAGVHLNIDPFLMQSITGALLTIAVVIDQLRQRRE